jgi:hypothetical protein
MSPPLRTWTQSDIERLAAQVFDLKIRDYDSNLQGKLEKIQQKLEKVERHGLDLFSFGPDGKPIGYLALARAEDKEQQSALDRKIEDISSGLKSQKDHEAGRQELLGKIWAGVAWIGSLGGGAFAVWLIHFLYMLSQGH